MQQPTLDRKNHWSSHPAAIDAIIPAGDANSAYSEGLSRRAHKPWQQWQTSLCWAELDADHDLPVPLHEEPTAA